MAETIKNIAGREIHRLRLSKGLTQEAFAAALQVHGFDMSRNTLAKVESGIRCVSDIELVVFAEVLGCTPNDLLNRGFKDCLNMLSSKNVI
jgi:transcriptional regulator with XRE-family HTH domain